MFISTFSKSYFMVSKHSRTILNGLNCLNKSETMNNIDNDVPNFKDATGRSPVTVEGIVNSSTSTTTNEELTQRNFKTVIKGKCNRLIKKTWEEKFQETEYYFKDGLRKVYPYMFTYSTFIKGRWIGRPLMEVFAEEFVSHCPDQYKTFVDNGWLRVNDEMVQADYVCQKNDIISSRLHRHELPVVATPIKIIHNSNGLLVIDKPPSIPVHACGRYRSNSIVFILGKEHGFKNLNVIHRLDRLTSGVLMFGLDIKATRDIEEQIRARTISKEYLCRVEGNFPDGHIECEEPIARMSHKLGLSMVDPTGKPCKTQFKKLSYNGKSSVVLCKPLTGRMHQIRVHLQYLGYPIVNDPNYNHPSFGPFRGKGGIFGKPKEEIIEDIRKEHTKQSWMLPDDHVPDDPSNQDGYDVALKSLKHYTDGEDFKILLKRYVFREEKGSFVHGCIDCMHKYRDPNVSELVMFLHAFRYKGSGFDFQSSIPVWAREDWAFS